MMDMQEHGPDWDEDTVQIEVEDELCQHRMVATEEAVVWARPCHALLVPVFAMIMQADKAAGLWAHHSSYQTSTES